MTRSMPSVARTKRFHLRGEEPGHDDEEATASIKVRRAGIAEKRRAGIDARHRARVGRAVE